MCGSENVVSIWMGKIECMDESKVYIYRDLCIVPTVAHNKVMRCIIFVFENFIILQILM